MIRFADILNEIEIENPTTGVLYLKYVEDTTAVGGKRYEVYDNSNNQINAIAITYTYKPEEVKIWSYVGNMKYFKIYKLK